MTAMANKESVTDDIQPAPPASDDTTSVTTEGVILCGRRRRRRRRRRPRNMPRREGPRSPPSSVNSDSPTLIYDTGEVDPALVSQVGTGVSNPHKRRSKLKIILAHHIFTKGAWRRARVAKHPCTSLRLSPEHDPGKETDVQGLADSGGQSDVWSLDEYCKAGYSPDDLSPVALSLNAANKSAIHVDGAFFTTISGTTSDGGIITCKSMVYVSRDVHGFYLSYSTMLNLDMLSPEFPTPGCARNQSTPDIATIPVISSNPTIQSTSIRTMDGRYEDCMPPDGKTCREDVPEITELPFPCTPENNAKMREWLLERFSKSTFCKCLHHPIPTMSGPPLEIHVKEDAKPYCRHKAKPVPVHWQQKVYDDLLRDEALGVIERVPYGEPVEWCHSMVLTRKHDGTPRRTVDLSPLNKQCRRETHNSESPFHTARRIPANTYKTVTDVWNGYHLVELKEFDRHLTTFTTPFGLWRYKRAIQGFASSGDAFNRRFDAILAGFERKERVVDDTCHHDTDLEEHWWRTIKLLTVAGKSGVIFNPEKFQFAQRVVDFAGFRVSEDRIDPLPKYFSAIRDFPTPKSTTDIRSWFGLVNQVANYAQLRDIMAPFRPFLSEKHPFYWNIDLEEAFLASKEAIIDAIREGVEIFDPNRRTCLRPDWSIKGIGYFLLQQHCSCPSQLPNCCPSGWRITLAGSRFLQSAEERYAPVEGEALAVAWALEQTRYFTQGCDDLIVVTDHEPIVKLLGDRTLDEIANTRLFRLKQRTLPWNYQIFHLPRKTNFAADAASRHPSPEGHLNLLELGDRFENALIFAIKHDTNTLSITWDSLVLETQRDPTLKLLLHYTVAGFPQELPTLHPEMKPYWRYKNALYQLDGVLMYDDRVVVPPSLRQQAVDILHSAHQGVSSIEARARTTVFWPGMTTDIDNARASCRECIQNAPSQPRLPPAPFDPPSTPFEQIVGDYFGTGACHYLVVADRLSGWPEVFKSTPGSPQSGVDGLIHCLRNCFACFGVPVQLSSDGGPEFSANRTHQFLDRWGVAHRGSSAYHPQSNGRAEVAVKTVKRLLRLNTNPNGSLNNDKFLRAMLQLRNTPDPDCNLSPAQVMFGRPLRDAFSFLNRLEKFSNPNIRPTWREAWQEKETALRQRYHRTSEALTKHSRAMPPLSVGDRCYVQNQAGNFPKRWDRSGTIVEDLGHDSYSVKIDGSGRLTKRNRQFLRKFTAPTFHIDLPGTALRPLPLDTPPSASHRYEVVHPAPAARAHPVDSAGRDGDQNAAEDNASTAAVPVPDIDSPAGGPQTINPPSIDEQLPSPTSAVTSRPRRATTAPLRYEPETGQWV